MNNRTAGAAAAAALAAALAGCAPPAIVVVSPNYDARAIRRVAVLGFGDQPGSPGSGSLAADTFEKYLLQGGYSLVERRQVSQVLDEQALEVSPAVDEATIRKVGRLLGVDAVALGSVTEYSHSRQQTVMVDMPQEQSDPIFGEIVTVTRNPTGEVRTVQKVVTGYNVTQTDQLVPEVRTVPARVALSVRLVAIDSGTVLWSASAASEGADLNAAAEDASSKIMEAVVKRLKSAVKPAS